MNRFGRKRRFIATLFKPRAIPRTPQEQEQEPENQEHATEEEEVSLGVTPPSRRCLPDSVLALVCPRCEIVFYISRGHLGSITSSLEVVEALAPGQISWFNPKHTPCKTLMRRISLEKNVPDDRTT